MNDYVPDIPPLAPFSLAKPAEVDARIAAVAAGFGLLPPPKAIQQDRVTDAGGAGTASSIIAALAFPPDALEKGLVATITPVARNIGPVTLNLNGLGAAPVLNPDGTPLVAGQLVEGGSIRVRYDGAAFRILTGSYPVVGPAGPADNTYTSYSALQASDPKQRSARLVGDTDTPPRPDGPYSNPLGIVGGWVPQTAAGIVTRLVAPYAVTVTQEEVNAETVNVRRFGAKGDNSAIDTAAIQYGIDELASRGGGTLLFSNGIFRTNAPIKMRDRVHLRGVGSHAGSLISGTHGGDLFQCVSLDYASMNGLAFTGPGCTALRQTGDTTVDYIANFHAWDCHFYGQLEECIFGNLIYAKIMMSSFGYFGTVGQRHRHIVSRGTATNSSNSNSFYWNRFYFAKGNESCRIENGIDNVFRHNNWEQNDALPVRSNGCPNFTVDHSFFEQNRNTQSEIEINKGEHIIDSGATSINHNNFVHAPSISRVVQVDTKIFGGKGWSFRDNTGSGVAITNDAQYLMNSAGAAILNDASGAGLQFITPLAPFKREGGLVTINASLQYPATMDNRNARIGGLPFASDGITVGNALVTVDGGAVVATDGNAPSMTLFAPGTLTPLTNAQLSGKALYISMTYFVPEV